MHVSNFMMAKNAGESFMGRVGPFLHREVLPANIRAGNKRAITIEVDRERQRSDVCLKSEFLFG